MSIIIKQTRNELLPVGEYLAVITEVEADDSAIGQLVRFEFEIEYNFSDSQKLLAWTRAKFSPTTELYSWTKAAFNFNIPDDYDFNSDDLLGRLVWITVLTRSNENGTKYNLVESLQPYYPSNGKEMPLPSSLVKFPF